MKHIGADSAPEHTIKSIDIIIIANLFILFRDYYALCLSTFALMFSK